MCVMNLPRPPMISLTSPCSFSSLAKDVPECGHGLDAMDGHGSLNEEEKSAIQDEEIVRTCNILSRHYLTSRLVQRVRKNRARWMHGSLWMGGGKMIER